MNRDRRQRGGISQRTTGGGRSGSSSAAARGSTVARKATGLRSRCQQPGALGVHGARALALSAVTGVRSAGPGILTVCRVISKATRDGLPPSRLFQCGADGTQRVLAALWYRVPACSHGRVATHATDVTPRDQAGLLGRGVSPILERSNYRAVGPLDRFIGTVAGLPARSRGVHFQLVATSVGHAERRGNAMACT